MIVVIVAIVVIVVIVVIAVIVVIVVIVVVVVIAVIVVRNQKCDWNKYYCCQLKSKDELRGDNVTYWAVLDS